MRGQVWAPEKYYCLLKLIFRCAVHLRTWILLLCYNRGTELTVLLLRHLFDIISLWRSESGNRGSCVMDFVTQFVRSVTYHWFVHNPESESEGS